MKKKRNGHYGVCSTPGCGREEHISTDRSAFPGLCPRCKSNRTYWDKSVRQHGLKPLQERQATIQFWAGRFEIMMPTLRRVSSTGTSNKRS